MTVFFCPTCHEPIPQDEVFESGGSLVHQADVDFDTDYFPILHDVVEESSN